MTVKQNIDRDVNVAISLLGDPKLWKVPPGYPKSLALCVIDSIWSIGVRYSSVEKVIQRYSNLQGFSDWKECNDSPTNFLVWAHSDIEANDWLNLANKISNRQKTSSRNGILKAEAVVHGMETLRNYVTTQDFLLDNESKYKTESEWKKIKGQKSGISWRYLRMLAGADDYKPDRMVKKFVREYVKTEISHDKFMQALLQKLQETSINIDMKLLDHEIWSFTRSVK